MIVTKNVKGSVDHESEQLLSSRYALSPGVVPGDLGADVNVADYRASFPDGLEGKGYHVGGAVVTEVSIVKLRDRGSPYERDR